jgi:hypothetical protein
LRANPDQDQGYSLDKYIRDIVNKLSSKVRQLHEWVDDGQSNDKKWKYSLTPPCKNTSLSPVAVRFMSGECQISKLQKGTSMKRVS